MAVLLCFDFVPGWDVVDSANDVVDALSFWDRSRERASLPSPDSDVRSRPGNINFFCLEGGRISSRSTGTPRLIRNKRRIRDCVQFGGCRGGGVMSCFHRDRDRSLGNIGESEGMGSGVVRVDLYSDVVVGNMVSRCDWVLDKISGNDKSASKSTNGNDEVDICCSGRGVGVADSIVGSSKPSSKSPKSPKSSSAPAASPSSKSSKSSPNPSPSSISPIVTECFVERRLRVALFMDLSSVGDPDPGQSSS